MSVQTIRGRAHSVGTPLRRGMVRAALEGQAWRKHRGLLHEDAGFDAEMLVGMDQRGKGRDLSPLAAANSVCETRLTWDTATVQNW